MKLPSSMLQLYERLDGLGQLTSVPEAGASGLLSLASQVLRSASMPQMLTGSETMRGGDK